MEAESLHVRLPPADLAAVQQEAIAKKVPVSEIVRQAVREHLARQTLARAVPLLDQALGKHVDRLAALIAKAFVAADIAAWQTRALAAKLLDDIDPADLMAQARERALIDLRRPGTDVGVDEDAYAREG
jgi:hypothetical protein